MLLHVHVCYWLLQALIHYNYGLTKAELHCLLRSLRTNSLFHLSSYVAWKSYPRISCKDCCLKSKIDGILIWRLTVVRVPNCWLVEAVYVHVQCMRECKRPLAKYLRMRRDTRNWDSSLHFSRPFTKDSYGWIMKVLMKRIHSFMSKGNTYTVHANRSWIASRSRFLNTCNKHLKGA